MSRIDPFMTGMDAVVAMADGNPGAVVVLSGLVQRDVFAILHLDEMGIYGSDIWRCYKDVCGESMDMLMEKIFDGSIAQDLNPGVTV